MVLYKAGKNNKQIKKWGLAFQIPVAFGISAVLAVTFYFVLAPFLEKRITAKFEKKEKAALAAASGADVEAAEKKGIGMSEKSKISTVNEDTADANSELPKDPLGFSEKSTRSDVQAKDTLSFSERSRQKLTQGIKKMADSTINRDIEAEGEIISGAQSYIHDNHQFLNFSLPFFPPLPSLNTSICII